MDEEEANAVRAKIARIEKRLRELDELKEEKKRTSKPTGGDLAAFLINERLEAERAAREEEEERSRQSKLTGGDLVAFLINERVDAERAAREEESDTEDESEYETEAEEEWEEESETKFNSAAASEEESVSVSFEEPVAESTGEWEEDSEGDYEAEYEESEEEDWEEESLESESEGEFEDAEIVADEDGAETDSDSDSEFWADLEGQAEKNRQLRSDIQNWLSYRLSGRYYSDKLRDKQPAVESEGWCESGKREEEAVTAEAEDSSSSRVVPPRDESEPEYQLSQENRDMEECELVSMNGEGRKEVPEKRVEGRGDQEERGVGRDELELESCAVENCQGAGTGDVRHQAETGTVTLRPDGVSEEPVETHRRLVTENYVERYLRLVKDRGKL